MIICFFFLYRQQRHFWNTVEHLWRVFLWKKVVNYFSKRAPPKTFGSTHSSWQYCLKNSHLKDILQLSKTIFVFTLIMHIFFCQTNQKNVLQKGMKDWTFEVCLLTGNSIFDSGWLNHWKWLVPDPMPGSWIFLSNGGGFGLFLSA